MQTLKNNNTRLTMALEESSQHVAQWKLQLQKYKEENDSLKLKVIINWVREKQFCNTKESPAGFV